MFPAVLPRLSISKLIANSCPSSNVPSISMFAGVKSGSSGGGPTLIENILSSLFYA